MRKRRILLFLLWILSLTAITFYGGAISYGFFFAITLLPIISGLYLLYVYIRFWIYQEVESRQVICGQPIPYYFVLENGDYFAFASVSVRFFSRLSFVEEFSDELEYELLAGERRTYRTKLICKYRGEYEVGVKEVVVTDFFRLFRLCYRIPGTIKAVVYPRVIQLEELRSLLGVNAFISDKAARMQTEPDVIVRDYIPGDAMKFIHWKVSARQQKLKVRTMTGEEKQGISFLFETKRYSEDECVYLPQENKILETLLALSMYFAKRATGCDVFYEQQELKCRHLTGMWDFDAFYREMTHIMFYQEADVRTRLMELISKGTILNSKILIGILSTIDEELMAGVRLFTQSGIMVVLYIVTDEDIAKYRRQGDERLQIVSIPVEANLEEVL